MFGEFLFHVFADDAGLDAGHHVGFINPFDFVHSCHVHRDDGSFLTCLQHERLGDVGASTERDQHDIVFLCCLDQEFSLFVGADVDYVVHAAIEFVVAELVEFLDRVPVGVEDS